MRSLIIAEKPELVERLRLRLTAAVRKSAASYVSRMSLSPGHTDTFCACVNRMSMMGNIKNGKKRIFRSALKTGSWVPDGNKKDRVEQIMALMQECDQIIHAGDPDDEGQFLIDEILDYAQNEKPVNGIYQ